MAKPTKHRVLLAVTIAAASRRFDPLADRRRLLARVRKPAASGHAAAPPSSAMNARRL